MAGAIRVKNEGQHQDAAIKAYNDIKHLEQRLASMIDTAEGSNSISFGFTVLSCVAHGNYDRALKELDCVGDGFEEYVYFKVRTTRFVEHAKGLVAAIRVKHMIGKTPHINKSKQRELSDKIADHFLELKRTIVMIEKIQKNVRAEDLSSTIIFMRTFFYSVATVILFAGLMYAYSYLDITVDSLFSLDFF